MALSHELLYALAGIGAMFAAAVLMLLLFTLIRACVEARHENWRRQLHEMYAKEHARAQMLEKMLDRTELRDTWRATVRNIEKAGTEG